MYKHWVMGIFLIIGLFSACHRSENLIDSDEKKIVTSFYPIYIMTLNVTKNVDDVKVTNMAAPTAGCLHDYQLTPKDLKTIENADIFVVNGYGAENFLENIEENYPALAIVNSSSGIEDLLYDDDDDGDDDHHHDGEVEVNAHFWLSIELATQQVQKIADELALLDPTHAEIYAKNAEVYIDQLAALNSELHSAFAPYQGQTVVTFHESYDYFAREYGFEVLATVTTHADSSSLSPQHVKDLIELIKAQPGILLLTEKGLDAPINQILEKETGVTSYMLDTAISGDEELDSYLRSMKYNKEVLLKALSAEAL